MNPAFEYPVLNYDWRFLEVRLSAETARLANGARAACIFVNEHTDHPALEIFQWVGEKPLALRLVEN